MVKVRIQEPGEWITHGPCSSCKTKLEYLSEPSKTSYFNCPKCNHKIDLDDKTASPSTSKDVTYYNILSIPVDATNAEIKKAYHKRAARIHPDKTGGTTTAEFLELQEAYNILSNEDSRAHYDKHGRGQADDISDIQARFGGLFGGAQGRFDEWIGEISIISEMGNAIRKGENGSVTETDGDGQKRAARVAMLTRNLANKLDQFDHANPDKFDKLAHEWMDDLKAESFGVELLRVIGQVYGLKGSASQYHPDTATRWTGSWLPSLRMKGLYITSTVSTVRKAYRVKSAFAKLEKTGEGGEAPAKAGLEEEAAKAAIEAIWEGVRAEVIGVIADACEQILTPDPASIKPMTEKHEIESPVAVNVSEEERRVLQKRSIALEKLGRLFETVQRDAGQQDIFEMLAQGPKEKK